ncbi:MAG: hypothetical protein KAS04_06270 [Candidatus Aenigmarchaeota archaeon]|nr:hypothetical protein [Candidatus Aenigmarchaeota archaeon]
MSQTWVDLYTLTDLQTKIMHFVDDWARTKKTPIPHGEIIIGMKKDKVKESSSVYAIRALLHKGYIRRAIIRSNKFFYVQLRRV